MARGCTFVTVLAAVAAGVRAETREDDVTLIQQGVRKAADVSDTSDISLDVAADSGIDASVIGQGVATFVGVVQAMSFEMTIGHHYAALTPAGSEVKEPSSGKCTADERERANQTMVRLASAMLGPSSLTAVMNSTPTACPKDPITVAAMAVGNTNFGTCLHKHLGVSEPCSKCMVSFVNRARSCISQCIPMLMECTTPWAWSDNDKAGCPKKSSDCLACNVPHMKAMTECSGAFPSHHEEYYNFLDGAIHLVKDGSLTNPQKLNSYVVQFAKTH